jgi:hypothetical protein
MSKNLLADKKKKKPVNPILIDKKEKKKVEAKYEIDEEFWNDCSVKENQTKPSTSLENKDNYESKTKSKVCLK